MNHQPLGYHPYAFEGPLALRHVPFLRREFFQKRFYPAVMGASVGLLLCDILLFGGEGALIDISGFAMSSLGLWFGNRQ